MIHMRIWIPDPLAEHIDLILSSQLTFYYKDQQIRAHRPHPAHHLFLYGLWSKDGFYISKWLRKKNKRRIFHNTEKFYKIQISGSLNTVLLGHIMPIHLHIIYGCARIAQLSSYNRDHYSQQILKYLLLGPLQGKLVEPCSKEKNTWLKKRRRKRSASYEVRRKKERPEQMLSLLPAHNRCQGCFTIPYVMLLI